MSQPPGTDATELHDGDPEGEVGAAPADPGPPPVTAAELPPIIPAASRDTSASDTGRVLLTYASSWFTYHAGQRLQSFNFFVALQTALIAVVALQYGTSGRLTLVMFGAVGFVGALLFAALEIRNTELVLAGSVALAALESSFHAGGSVRATEIPLPQSDDDARRYLRKALIGFLAPKDILPMGCPPASRRRYKVLGYVIRNAFVLRLIFLLTLAGWLAFVGLILTSYQPSRPSCSVTVHGSGVARVVCGTSSAPASHAETSGESSAPGHPALSHGHAGW